MLRPVGGKKKSLNSLKSREECHLTFGVFRGQTRRVILCPFSDVDECSQERDLCSAHATCSNTIGSYDCSCKAGHTCDGRHCRRLGKNPLFASKVGPRLFNDNDDIQQ